jgi:diaminopimelate decarboxylase
MNTALKPDKYGITLVQELAEAHQTPFYLYDTGVFAARIEMLLWTLPGNSNLLYSAKANPHKQLLRTACASGCGLELASSGEVERGLAAGLDLQCAILVGPAKSDAFLASALTDGIGIVVVESVNELRRLETVAVAMAIDTIPVLLRLNVDGAKGSLRMSGHQFGMEYDDIILCHTILSRSSVLNFRGYHGYLASQLLDAGEIVHNTELLLDEMEELTRTTGAIPDIIDLGGGFGIPYTLAEPELDLSVLTEGLKRLMDRGTASASRPVFESGRFLAGPAGALICRVVDIKTIRERRFIIVDAGMNSSGIFGGARAIRSLALSVIRDGTLLGDGAKANICGPLCTPMDRLATSVPCAADVGDLIIWWNMGAYGLTAAPTAFLSFPLPGEVIV